MNTYPTWAKSRTIDCLPSSKRPSNDIVHRADAITIVRIGNSYRLNNHKIINTLVHFYITISKLQFELMFPIAIPIVPIAALALWV